jgi:hypothetical protein
METPMIDIVLNNLIPSSEAAVLLNCDERTLRRHRRAGALVRHKVKGKVYYSIDDIAKLKSIKEDPDMRSRHEKRIKFLESEVRMLRIQVKLLASVAGFRTNDIDSLSLDDAKNIKNKMKDTMTTNNSITEKDLLSWVNDIRRFSSNVIEIIGTGFMHRFVDYLIACARIMKTDKSLTAAKQLEAKLIDFPLSELEHLDEA